MAILRYSEKTTLEKKRHSVKNIVLSLLTRFIIYLSYTESGSVHDKKLAEEQEFSFDKVVKVLQDSGFQGLDIPNADIEQPVKKPRGAELTEAQKRDNKAKSAKRVLVENSIGSAKIWRTAKDICRSWLYETRDLLFCLACGLHNFRLKVRHNITFNSE